MPLETRESRPLLHEVRVPLVFGVEVRPHEAQHLNALAPIEVVGFRLRGDELIGDGQPCPAGRSGAEGGARQAPPMSGRTGVATV